VGGGKVDEVVGSGGFLEVGANGGGGAAVFAVPDAQFLELLDASCCHDCCINIIYIVIYSLLLLLIGYSMAQWRY